MRMILLDNDDYVFLTMVLLTMMLLSAVIALPTNLPTAQLNVTPDRRGGRQGSYALERAMHGLTKANLTDEQRQAMIQFLLLRVGEDGKPVCGSFTEAANVFQKSSKTCERLWKRYSTTVDNTMVLAVK